GDTLLYVVVAAHGEERAELVFPGDGAELGDVRNAVRRGFHAHHVERAHRRYHSGEEIGALGHRAPDEDAAGAAAKDAEARARGVLLLDEILRAGDEVLPGVRLRRLVARLVPIVAVDATAAHIRHGVHAAALKPGEAGRVVARLL